MSTYNITILNQDDNTVLFTGVFSIDDNFIVQNFQEYIGGTLGENILVPVSTPVGSYQPSYNSELSIPCYTTDDGIFQYDDAFYPPDKSPVSWYEFDNNGIILSKMSFAPTGFEFNLCANNTGDEVSTNNGAIVYITPDYFFVLNVIYNITLRT